MNRLRSATQIVIAILREIFDEAAYARFLERNCVQSSRGAYEAFWRERELAQARRPKCC
jgi:hypothetical protein